MQLAEGVHAFGQRKGGRVHAFLFEHGGELTLVDTLFDTDAKVVLEYLRGLGRAPGEVKRIAVTHAHRSHLGGLAALKRLSGATVYAHEWEADIISGDRPAQPVPFLPIRPLVLQPFRLGLRFRVPKHAPCPVDESVSEGDSVGPLDVLHVPGHTPGHLAFYSEQQQVLVAGDAIATWPTFGGGWPGFQLNDDQHRESLRRLAGLGAKAVGVGHGEPLTEASGSLERVQSLV